MVEKTNNNNENVRKRDLELILEVNKKAIEIESEVIEQNEDIIASLDSIKRVQEDHDDKLVKLVKQSEEITKDLFKIQILFITGLLSLVVQIVQIFLKK